MVFFAPTPIDYAVFKERFLYVLVQQPLSTFPFCAAGNEQALPCRRPFSGFGLLSAPWPCSRAQLTVHQGTPALKLPGVFLLSRKDEGSFQVP